jgi:uncharacterized protein YjbI with pentapeptide repeats
VIIAVIVLAAALLWATWVLWGQWWLRVSDAVIAIVVLALVSLAAIVAVIWWLWWRLPQRQVAKLTLWETKARADTEDNFRKTAGQALGGAAVLIGAVVAYLQFTQQQQASHDLLISNQVSKGFEQLASDKITERLGGIYALEGVMNTSDQYHKPVLEALCAFVRESTTRQKGPLTVLLEALFAAPREGTAEQAEKKPPNDIQAALTVIGRRKAGPGGVNLAGAHIPHADLNGADLSRADLNGADLSDAFLHDANLSGAGLSGADLSGAWLRGADLSGAFLIYAHLNNADLSGADLSTINLTQAELDKACGKPKTPPPGLTLDKPCQSRPVTR